MHNARKRKILYASNSLEWRAKSKIVSETLKCHPHAQSENDVQLREQLFTKILVGECIWKSWAQNLKGCFTKFIGNATSTKMGYGKPEERHYPTRTESPERHPNVLAAGYSKEYDISLGEVPAQFLLLFASPSRIFCVHLTLHGMHF